MEGKTLRFREPQMTRILEIMICPDCGVEMNHHAMKVDYSTGDGVVQEVHTCPECGGSELRQVE